VEPGFVVQGGDPNGTGTGGPGYNIKAEFSSKPHLRGTLAMARAADPDSAGSQFYICLGPAPFLDGKYTVFGQVKSGMEAVDAIRVGDRMKKVSIKK
jgi:peptidyl-prolyl cis-trans isomerase B (cyclophilin B)